MLKEVKGALCLLASLAIVFFIAFIHICSAILFALGQSITILMIPIALLATVIFLIIALFIVTKKGGKMLGISTGLLLTFLVVSGFSFIVAGNVYDTSWDGQDYHQVGIVSLAEGGNPVYETLPDDISADPSVSIWANHYARATWIVAANIYKLTGHLEYGKALNLLLIFASLFACLGFLLESGRFSGWAAAVISLLVAFNPISMYQFLTFYVDGVLSSVMILLFAFAGYILLKRQVVLSSIGFALMLIFAVNVKFTGLVYAGLLVAGLSIGLLIVNKRFLPALKAGLLYTAIFFAGIILVGFSPYMTNLQQKGNPLFPVFGEGKVDIITRQLPQNFKEMGTMERFYHSLFSRSGGGFSGRGFASSELKMPFTYESREVAIMGLDTRVAGFGPLFSGVLLLSLALLLVVIVLAASKREWKLMLFYMGYLFWVLATVFINSQSWWARYVPQLWLVPLVILLFSFDKAIFRRWLLVLQAAVIFVAAFNLFISAGNYISQSLTVNREVVRVLNSFKESGQPVHVRAGRFETAFRAKLKDIGVERVAVETLNRDLYESTFVFPASFGGIYCGVKPVASENALAVKVETVLPEKIEIVEPAADLPPEIAAFSGRWAARWSGWIDTRFIIVEIDREKARVLFSWGSQLSMMGRNAGYEYIDADVVQAEGDTYLHFSDSNGVEHKLFMGPNLNSIEGVGLSESYESTGYLRREGTTEKSKKLVRAAGVVRKPFTGTPLPDDISVIKPGSEMDQLLSAYSGRWEGYISGLYGLTIIVERVTSQGLEFVISWAEVPGEMEAGFSRERLPFDANPAFATGTMTIGVPITVKAGSGPDSLEVVLRSGYEQVVCYMRRCSE